MDVVIILGVIIGLIYSYIKGKRADKQMKEHQTHREYLRQRLIGDGILYKEIEAYVYSGEHYQEICKKFADDFRFVFGDNWKEKLMIPPNDTKTTASDHHMYWVVQLLLAEKGKMHKFEYDTYYTIRIPHDGYTLQFMQCVERRLQKHHPDLNIRFAKIIDESMSLSCFTIESATPFPTRRLW